MSVVRNEKGEILKIVPGSAMENPLECSTVINEILNRLRKLELEKEARDLKIIESHYSK